MWGAMSRFHSGGMWNGSCGGEWEHGERVREGGESEGIARVGKLVFPVSSSCFAGAVPPWFAGHLLSLSLASGGHLGSLMSLPVSLQWWWSG